jgi:hypothetical protein
VYTAHKKDSFYFLIIKDKGYIISNLKGVTAIWKLQSSGGSVSFFTIR